jgi:hypothetical protein
MIGVVLALYNTSVQPLGALCSACCTPWMVMQYADMETALTC